MTTRRALPLLALCILACEKDRASQPPTTTEAVKPADDDPDALGKACDGGDANACSQLGYLYAYGRDGKVLVNAPLAAAAYEKGCNLGHAGACGTLGMSYAAGTGVPQDREKGIALVDKACTMKDAHYCFSLAVMHGEDANIVMAGMREDLTPEQAEVEMKKYMDNATKYVAAACTLGHECACLAQKTGACDSADACSARADDGSECYVTCAQEYGCTSGVFALIMGDGGAP